MSVSGQTPAPDAQTVFGMVSDSAGPLAAVFVQATTPGGARVAARLTDAQGRFRMELPRGATYNIHVERVGYADARTRVETGTAPAQYIRLVLNAQPFTLAAVQAEAKPQCRGVTPETARLWAEVSKVLRVAEWTDDSGSVDRDYLIWTRTFKASDESVISYTPRTLPRTKRTPFKSMNPADLIRSGFVRSLPDTVVYLAPDAHTVLSAEFLATHCFHVNEAYSRANAELVGLSFKPVAAARLPDVRGTLWLTPDSLQLKHLEYEYTNLPGDGERETGKGRVEFQHLPGGEWIISRWWIRLPLYTQNRGQLGSFNVASYYKLIAYHEDGGEVRVARATQAGAGGWGSTGGISGIVYDSIRSRALAGVVVMLAGTPWKSAATDSTGRFTIASVPAGSYSLQTMGSTLDSIPPELRPSAVVAVAAGAEAKAELALPGYGRFRQRLCSTADNRMMDDVTFVVGTLETHAAGQHDTIDVSATRWLPDGRTRDATVQRTTWTSTAAVGPDGWFRICDVPAGLELKVSLPGEAPTLVKALRQTVNFVRIPQPKP